MPGALLAACYGGSFFSQTLRCPIGFPITAGVQRLELSKRRNHWACGGLATQRWRHIEVPPGALTAPVAIRLEPVAAPRGYRAVGTGTQRFLPEGLHFSAPGTVRFAVPQRRGNRRMCST